MNPDYSRQFIEAMALEPAAAESRMVEMVEAMKAEGLSQVEIYCFFDERYSPNNQLEDIELEPVEFVLERIWGWCDSSRWLFPKGLTNDEVRAYQKSLEQEP